MLSLLTYLHKAITIFESHRNTLEQVVYVSLSLKWWQKTLKFSKLLQRAQGSTACIKPSCADSCFRTLCATVSHDIFSCSVPKTETLSGAYFTVLPWSLNAGRKHETPISGIIHSHSSCHSYSILSPVPITPVHQDNSWSCKYGELKLLLLFDFLLFYDMIP